MHLYVKHATLISNCYPEKEGEKGPKSSELSYLVFYANSRPVKLTKVGLFLEKKVERDVAKGRKQNNQVSLEIVKSLIKSCHRDLNLFSKYVVKIMDIVLDSKDIDLIDLTCDVFIVFASFHEGSTLGVDTELTREYELLLEKFASFCNDESEDEEQQLQLRYIGQRALQAAVNSNALQSSNYDAQLNRILSPLMATLSLSKNSAKALAQSNAEDADIMQSAIEHETLNAHTVDIIAVKTTALLFQKVNAVNVKLSLEPFFSYMDEHEKWWPANFASSMMELVLDSLQPQYRYLLVTEVLQQLDKIDVTDSYYSIEKHASLVSILDKIFNAQTPLVGISVLELLNTLFTHLIKSVQDFEVFHDGDLSGEEFELEYIIQQGLIRSIGGLASQTYYINQLNDITGYIISKLKVTSNTLDAIDGLPIVVYRKVLLSCLDIVGTSTITLNENKEESEFDAGNTPIYRSTMTLDIWVPALPLLVDNAPETRVHFASTLVNYLEATSEKENSVELYPKHTLNQPSDVQFVTSLHKVLYDWIQLPNTTVSDMKAIQSLLIALTHKFNADQTIKALPLIFEIQRIVKQGVIKQTARQRAAAALVIEWLLMIAEYYRIDSLMQYAESVKVDRMNYDEYSTVFSDKDISTDSFEELEPENYSPVFKFIDKQKVVHLLSKDGPLRDEDDSEGKELENKLSLNWGSEDYENLDRTLLIRTSRNLTDLKAKLATPWIKPEINPTEPSKKQTIKVENLKEALGI
ncbi:hypothetical protein BDB01DRAFT_769677 [Pilobolus umbonatus]|nr:hypothetical protein BDB01DRAFT_769677 [Pilobolus umbonatus]